MPFGSAGDTFPFIGLGKHLQARGHKVTVVANGYFRPYVRQAGLSFQELWSKEAYLAALDNPDIWHPTKGFQAVVGHANMPAIVEDQHQLIIEHFLRNPNIVVVAGSLSFGARIARETHGIRLVTVHLSPAVFLSVEKPSKLPNLRIPSWWPRSWVRFVYWMGNRMLIHPVMQRVVGQYRKELLLPKINDYFRKWIHSHELVLGLWPSWFAEKVSDWPKQTRLLDFPFYDGHVEQPVTPEVVDFFNAGPPPVVMTFGSAMKVGGALFQATIQACLELKRRALVLTPYREQLPESLPASILHATYAPLSQILPYASCLVHHGGIGTTAQAFRAGVPQVITPLAHDQYDNAARVKALGVSTTVEAPRATQKRLMQAIQHVTQSPSIKQQAQELRQRFAKEACYNRMVEELESIAGRRASTRFHV